MLLFAESEGLWRCSMCGELKPLSEFHRRGESYQRWCKACRSPYDKAYYQKTRELRVLQSRERKAELHDWLHSIKTAEPCADCGGFFHPAAMTFDHLPGTEKIDEVSDLVRSGCTTLAKAEIAKCDLVCANCHAVRTYMRLMEAKRTTSEGRN